MIVIDICPINKTKYKILTDDESAFVLYKGDLSLMGISKDCPISSENISKIFEELLPKRCYNRMCGLLKNKDYTTYEIRNKLMREYYPDNIIDNTIERLTNERFFDDYRYACGYIRDKSKKKSIKTIARELNDKGISGDMFSRAYEEVFNDGDIYAEEELIKKLVAKRKYDPCFATYEDKMRLFKYLYGRGFSIDSINKVVNSSEF